MTNIDAVSLASVVGGKAATPAPSPQQPDVAELGEGALTGCLTGAVSSIKSGKIQPAVVGLGCALGAGKSLVTSLGKDVIGSIFGKPAPSTKPGR